MRVRVNFTVDVDVEEFRDRMAEDLTKVQVRERMQEDCIEYLMTKYGDEGIKVELLGRNNVYDPSQKLTVAEHLVR